MLFIFLSMEGERMARTPLREREMPDYTRGEEICNMVTHIVGGALGVVALVLCAVVGAMHHSAWSVVSGCVFGVCMIDASLTGFLQDTTNHSV